MRITKEQAMGLYETKFWEKMTHEEIARFQLFTDLLCMPFPVLHEAVEKTLGRPVFSHEFGSAGMLREELAGKEIGIDSTPTFEQIANMIPADKRIIVGL